MERRVRLAPPLRSSGGARPTLHTEQVLVVGPGGGKELAGDASAVASWLKSGGNLLTIGLDEQQITEFLPLKVRTKQAEHISSFFKPFGYDSLLAGIGPADVHCREPRNIPLLVGATLRGRPGQHRKAPLSETRRPAPTGVRIIGDGVLGKAENSNVVFCQLAPWQFDCQKQNTKRSFRRISFCLTRLLANMGAAGSTPLLERFANRSEGILPLFPSAGTPAPRAAGETPAGRKAETASPQRWMNGFYLDKPEEWDDPYRFFRW